MTSVICQMLTDQHTLEDAKAMDTHFDWSDIDAKLIAKEPEFKKSLMLTLGITQWTSSYTWIRMCTVTWEEYWHLLQVLKMYAHGKVVGDKVRSPPSYSHALRLCDLVHVLTDAAVSHHIIITSS